MAKLAIKGHPTRGKEVIKLLEMLGGVNKHQIDAIRQTYVYFIDIDNIIRLLQINQLLPEKDIVYSLEEFEEKYPYKVGDKVILDEIPCTITWMCWECNNIYYQVQGIGDVFTKKVTADELNLYKERNGMGNKLAIKGHPTRGKEIIELLEMLGANRLGYKDTFVGFYYYIECGAICSSDEYPTYATIFTLEEFLEKYPYKVGDEVEYKSIGDANLKSKIIYMEWCNTLNKVLYTTEDAHVISTEDITETKSIPPYMDYDIKENIEKNQTPKTQAEVDKYLQEHSVKNGMNVIDIENCLEMDGLKLPENVVINSKGIGSIQFIQWYEKSQYPRDFDECCEVLNLGEDGKLWTKGYKSSLVQSIHQLIICRDAYWKIAGEQMGLGKSWEYDMSKNEFSCAISYEYGSIQKCEVRYRNHFLVFPTKEMRDEFYNNFKDLIDSCKELL